MGFNFRKSISLGKGLKLNLGKKSASVTIGRKGIHHTISTTGRQTTTVGIPGTGLSYSTATGTKKSAAKKKTAASKTAAKTKTAEKKPETIKKAVGSKPAESAPKPSETASAAQTSAPSNPFSTGRAQKTHD